VKPLTIRVKLAIWSGIAMAVVLGAFAAGTLFNLYHRQVYEADDDIESETKELQVQFKEQTVAPEQVMWELDPHMGWVVFDSAGRLLRSDPIITEQAARPALGRREIVSTGGAVRGWRIRAFAVEPGRVVVVGYAMRKVYVVLTDLVLAYAWALPLAAVAMALGSWWVTGRALAPFRALADEFEGIQSEHLGRRVPEPMAKDEIRRLATSFNALLGRLARSFAQTRRFAADASHELRTPLTIMRGELELMLREPELSPAQQAKLASLQEEIGRLDRITEQLLMLARFEAGQIRIEPQRVDYSHLVAEACEQAELLAHAAGVKLSTDLAPGLHVTGDGHHLRRLLLNLLDNACKHNEPGGRVSCRLYAEGREVVLAIGNSGAGIPAELRERVFERFFRADASRTGARGHGLGLALSQEIAALHGGKLELGAASRSGWTEFLVRLPAAG
jgi:signal transduction histidine kinase